MAIPVTVLSGETESTPAAFAAPTATDTLAPGAGVWLYIKPGATPTTITLKAPANDAAGRVAQADYAIAGITTDRIIRVGRKWAGSNGLATITFAPLTSVTVLALDTRPTERS